MRKKELRKIARKARREFEAGRAVLPREKVIHRPVVAKLGVNGDQWTEEVRDAAVFADRDRVRGGMLV